MCVCVSLFSHLSKKKEGDVLFENLKGVKELGMGVSCEAVNMKI